MPSSDSLDRAVRSARDELSDSLDPTPPPFGQLRRRSTRRRSAALAAVAAIVVVAAIGVTRFDDEGEFVVAGPGDSPGEDGSNDVLLEPGASRPLAQSPLAGRSTMAAVWTGTEMLIWGGSGPEGPFDDGAAYDPRQDAWRLLPPSPLSPRNQPAAVWTGEEMLLWGGWSRDGGQRDGAAYNPATGRWRSVAEAPFASAGRPVGLWTGTEMVVLAGFNSRDAGIYDPATDEWRLLPELPGQLQAPNPVGMWTGDRVFAVVQLASVDYATEVVSLAPGDQGWTTEPDLPAGQKVLAWTGTDLVVAAGDEASVLTPDGRWDHVATAPAGVVVGDTPTVWTGSSLLLWGGDSVSFVDVEQAAWTVDPSLDTARRTQPAVVWANGVLLVWGGFPDEASGVMYRPGVTTDDEGTDPGPSHSSITEGPDAGVAGDSSVVTGCMAGFGDDTAPVEFFAQMVAARTTANMEPLRACLDSVPEVFTGEVPACWASCGETSRTFIEDSFQVSTIIAADGSESLGLSFAVTYDSPVGPVDVFEYWRLERDGEGYVITAPVLEEPVVDRDRSQAIIAAFLGHIDRGEWSQAAALYPGDGLDWNRRPDLIELAPDTFDEAGVAVALERWCDAGCDTEVPTADELTLRLVYGVSRNEERLEAGWYEGIYSIDGLPFRTGRPSDG